MADTVHYLMEQMVPELEDLERRGLFKRAEIKQIVKKRQDFEYLLKRRRGLKEDYLRYIDYEVKLEALRQHRKNVLVKQLQADNARLRWRSSLSDHAITRRIMFIYERASRKFKGDLSLWLQYLEYCRSKSGSRQMQKVLTKALQLHPARPALWIYAAAWEFEANQNASAARSLMQRGLRMCPKSELLWLEYLRMELTYTQRLKARREVLGLNTPVKQGAEATTGPVAKKRRIEMEGGAGDVATEAGSVGLDQLGYKVAAATFQNTVLAVPDSLELRTQFLKVLEQFVFEGMERLENEVYVSIERDFGADEQARACLALRWMRDQRMGRENGAALTLAEARAKAAGVFRGALETQRTTKMAEAYTGFLESCIEELREGELEAAEVTTSNGIRGTSEALELLQEHLETSQKLGLTSESMAERHVAVLQQQNESTAALETAAVYCEGRFKGSARLWVLRLGLAMRGSIDAASTEEREGRLDVLFEKALRSVALGDAPAIWNLAAERLLLQARSSERLLAAAEARLQIGNGSEGEALGCAVVDWIAIHQGLSAARKLYARLLALPAPGLALFQKCIQLETLGSPDGAGGSMDTRRPLFEAALEVHTQAWELWLEYCKQEMQEGLSQRAAMVYWRAKKALHNPSSFLAEYQAVS